MKNSTRAYVDSLFDLNTFGSYNFNPLDVKDAEFCSHFLQYERKGLDERKEELKNDLPMWVNEDISPNVRAIKDNLEIIDAKILSVKKWFEEKSLKIPKAVSRIEWKSKISFYDKRKRDKNVKQEKPNGFALIKKELASLTKWQRMVIRILKKSKEPVRHYDLIAEINQHVKYHHISKIFYTDAGKRFFRKHIDSETAHYYLINPDLIPEKF